jgi:hypothetical protein
MEIQGGSNMTGTNCDLFTHKSSRSYLNHLVLRTPWTLKEQVLGSNDDGGGGGGGDEDDDDDDKTVCLNTEVEPSARLYADVK